MESYALGIDKLDENIKGIRSGSNIMIIGPPMSGKETIINNIVYRGLNDGDAAVIVTTREPGENVLEWFNYNNLEISLDHLGIVDCVTKTLGVPTSDTANIRRASSPVDLTGIGVKISQFLEEFWMKKNIRKTRLCINSLSTILMYSNIQTVFRFLHVFTGRVKTAGAIGIYLVEEGMHDPQAVATLKQLFDGVIEIKEENDIHYIRTMGLSQKPSKWYEYTVEGPKIVLKDGE
ncbi:MAG: ATPase domain-containing protein [ANME-2 cluster archaeon]|nr:ATPase domain-containing protein [ANME-2 cluster archaeon]